jgi:8-oxo-dGTP pyrophosphatase MutT (NUDIX family)/ribosomal protein S18 acetylase RimI-like enzyme
MSTPLIREINPKSQQEIELVAKRMRLTLVDVLGEEEGGSMYTMEWLVDRVIFHLDSKKSNAQIFLSENPERQITGQCIVRIERDEGGNQFGLFSTTYVDPAFRKKGFANALLLRGEQWMLEHELLEAITYTSESNAKLIRLYEKHGYRIHLTNAEKRMIGLKKRLPRPTHKEKVLAYITRQGSKGLDLLVFEHRDIPEAGIQVPAGTVDPGESVSFALLREVQEESGLEFKDPGNLLGSFKWFQEDRNELHNRNVFHLIAPADVLDEWVHIVKGHDEDVGMAFKYYWIPLADAITRLAGKQGIYVEKVLWR